MKGRLVGELSRDSLSVVNVIIIDFRGVRVQVRNTVGAMGSLQCKYALY